MFKGISISTTKDGQGLKIADLGKARKVKFADDQDDEWAKYTHTLKHKFNFFFITL